MDRGQRESLYGRPARHRQKSPIRRPRPPRHQRRTPSPLLQPADLVDTLYRGLADNSDGRVIETILKAELILIDEIGFAPLNATGAQLFFRLVAAAYERPALGIGSHWPFEDCGRFLPEHTTAVSLLDRLLHYSVIAATEGESFRMKEARAKGGKTQTHEGLTSAIR